MIGNMLNSGLSVKDISKFTGLNTKDFMNAMQTQTPNEFMKLDKVTVAVITYNGEHLLEECLLAIKSQDYPSYEVIMVDNNSTDGSVKLVREKKNTYKIAKEIGIPIPATYYVSEEDENSPRRVSFSYFMGDQINAWRAYARWFDIDDKNSGFPTPVDGNAGGYWDFSRLMRYAQGINTSLTVYPEQEYWAAWSDCAGEGGFPVEVRGTHGWTD